MRIPLFAFLLATLATRTFSQVHEVDLNKVTLRHSDVTTLINSSGSNRQALLFKPVKPGQSLDIFVDSEEIKWDNFQYLVLDVVQKSDYSGILYLDFYKKGSVASRTIVQQSGEESKAHITPKIGVLPDLRTQVIFPLSYLDGQDIFMDRFPRQLKGTVLGRRLEKHDIGAVRLRIDPVSPPEFISSMEISSIRLMSDLPAPLTEASPVVDEFGQWSVKEWPGKVSSEQELKQRMEKLQSEVKGSQFPDEWSQFGGWKKLQFKSTGFFRTHHDGKRWWLVDPEGYAFVSAGVDCVDPGIPGPVEGNEDLFKWIPTGEDVKFSPAISKRREAKMVDYLKTNLIRVYGEAWEEQWQVLSKDVMKKYRMNTIANWSNTRFAQKADIPYTIPMRDYPTTATKLFRDFPDVFDPVYRQRAAEFAKQLEPFKDDPYLIGYFLSNEPHWAFGEHFIAFEMFGTPGQSYSKKKFASWLLSKYGSITALNQAWNTTFAVIDELTTKTYGEPTELTPGAMADMKEFSGLLVDEYVSVVCDEVKKVDPHHLNLGLRYAWISSELCYRAGAYFDVFSINGYSYPGPPETAEISKRSGKPIMIGEYHFGSADRGLPANGIQGAANQKDRGDAYRYYLENGFSRPEVVGLHYFQWNDQPIMGRFDGENYNIGFFDICNQPYMDLLNAAKSSHEVMYEVAAGKRKPFSKVIKKVPPIFY